MSSVMFGFVRMVRDVADLALKTDDEKTSQELVRALRNSANQILETNDLVQHLNSVLKDMKPSDN